MKLTAKQEKFCIEYLVDLNATQAAIRAGYSEKTAAVIGAENLIKPNIKEFIQLKQKELQETTGITQKRVLDEYAKIAFHRVSRHVTTGIFATGVPNGFMRSELLTD